MKENYFITSLNYFINDFITIKVNTSGGFIGVIGINNLQSPYKVVKFPLYGLVGRCDILPYLSSTLKPPSYETVDALWL